MEKAVQDFAEVSGEVITEYDEENLFSQDLNNLRRILPETVWRIVTNKLTNHHAALTSFANSSPYFRDVLSSQRGRFLFDDVFSVMTLRLWKTKGRKGLPFSNVLKCRAVCSSWNAGVDKFLKGKFLDAKLPTKMEKLRCSKLTNKFDTYVEQVVKFLDHFEATHGKPEVDRNPFIWNHLRVITNNEEDGMPDYDQENLEAVSSALRKYGRFISKFQLDIGGYEFYIEDALKLQDWLAHMPNLKTLTIHDHTFELEQDMSLDEFKTRMIAANFPPFIELGQLESLQVERLRSPIFNLLIRQNHHISKLAISKRGDQYNLYNLPFENLVSFEMTIDSVEMFENFKESSNIQWPKVQSLKIFFSPEENTSLFVPLSDIFSTIQSKFKNLFTLYLQLPKASTAEEAECLWIDSIHCRLNLPNLIWTKFVLESPISLDFLLEMKNHLDSIYLEILYPTKDVKINKSHSSIVPLNGFEENIRASNIPKLFPNLEGMRVSFGDEKKRKWYKFK